MVEPELRRQAAEWLIRVSYRDEDDVRIVSVEGEIDSLTAPIFQDAIDDGSAGAAGRAIVIDLTAVTFLASAGLAVLAQTASRLAPGSQPLRVVANSHAVIRPITVTGLHQILVLCHSIDEATAKAG